MGARHLLRFGVFDGVLNFEVVGVGPLYTPCIGCIVGPVGQRSACGMNIIIAAVVPPMKLSPMTLPIMIGPLCSPHTLHGSRFHL